MNSEMPTMPSLPTTAISADAPFSMTYSSDTMRRGRKVDVGLRAAGLVEHLAERQVDQLELGQPARQLGLRQRRQQLIALGVAADRHRTLS